MRVGLESWYSAWCDEHKHTDLRYAKDGNSDEASLHQVHFVRDPIALGLVWSDVPYDTVPRDDKGNLLTTWVICEHHSKSVRLPVCSIERPDLGIQFVMRNNFYGWQLSVLCERPIVSDLFPALFHTTPPVEPEYTGNPLNPVYWGGFPPGMVFGYHAENHRQWSAELTESSLWTTIFICMRSIGAIKDHAWRTRAGHLAELEADRVRRYARKGT